MKVQDKAISLNAVITTIYDSSGNFKNDFDQGFFADKIRALPPVTPQQQTGYWTQENSVLRCSICDVGVARYNKYPYCPNCGAKMVKSQERSE